MTGRVQALIHLLRFGAPGAPPEAVVLDIKDDSLGREVDEFRVAPTVVIAA